MVDPKIAARVIQRLLTVDEEDINKVIIGVLMIILTLMLAATFVVQILLLPLNLLTNVLFPEESQIIADFQKEYGYILEDLEEFSYDTNGSTSDSITFADAGEISQFLAGFDILPERLTYMENAMSLVGKVGYFWGGKSKAGWNDNWGEPRMVSAAGSKTSGTVQPYGLDCSGYVDWVYKTSGYGNILSGGVGYQWGQAYKIQEENLIPGDLAFKSPPGQKGINHIGIYLGKSAEGRNLFIHCAGGQGVVVNDYSFGYFRRVPIAY